MEFAIPVEEVTAIVTIHSLEQRMDLIESSKILVLKFGAEWCGPCKRIYPDYSLLALSHIGVCVFASEDIDDEFNSYASEIKSIPAFHIYKDGIFVDEVIGGDLTKVERCISEMIKEKE